VRLSKAQTTSRVHAIPQLRFEQQQLTSFSGLVLFQMLFNALGLRARLARCFRAARGVAYGTHVLFVQLVVHVLLGFRSLRDRDHYADDPLVARVCGVRRLADVATLSRRLGGCTDAEADAVDALGRELVLDRVAAEKLATVTLDFDGSVLTTRRHAEGTAVGYNKKRKGARSYYPLFCTVAQTSQFLSVLHRPGNVHDSNGACRFMAEQIVAVRDRLPSVRLEARVDAAFFDEKLLALLDREHVEFSASVPFERFPDGVVRQSLLSHFRVQCSSSAGTESLSVLHPVASKLRVIEQPRTLQPFNDGRHKTVLDFLPAEMVTNLSRASRSEREKVQGGRIRPFGCLVLLEGIQLHVGHVLSDM